VPNCKIDENEKEKYLLKKSDLVIARMASPGKVAIIERDINAVFASYLIKMTLDINNILPYYAFYTLTNDYYQGLFSNADTSATRGNINGQIISRFQIIIPPLELQKLFEKQILSIRNTLNNFVIQNETLTIIRDRLLTRLMSGKIDVENLDIQFPDSMKEEAAAHA
jgi:type I restriction enzyme S subunit